jgi:hypothetical protein
MPEEQSKGSILLLNLTQPRKLLDLDPITPRKVALPALTETSLTGLCPKDPEIPPIKTELS